MQLIRRVADAVAARSLQRRLATPSCRTPTANDREEQKRAPPFRREHEDEVLWSSPALMLSYVNRAATSKSEIGATYRRAVKQFQNELGRALGVATDGDVKEEAATKPPAASTDVKEGQPDRVSVVNNPAVNAIVTNVVARQLRELVHTLRFPWMIPVHVLVSTDAFLLRPKPGDGLRREAADEASSEMLTAKALQHCADCAFPLARFLGHRNADYRDLAMWLSKGSSDSRRGDGEPQSAATVREILSEQAWRQASLGLVSQVLLSRAALLPPGLCGLNVAPPLFVGGRVAEHQSVSFVDVAFSTATTTVTDHRGVCACVDIWDIFVIRYAHLVKSEGSAAFRIIRPMRCLFRHGGVDTASLILGGLSRYDGRRVADRHVPPPRHHHDDVRAKPAKPVETTDMTTKTSSPPLRLAHGAAIWLILREACLTGPARSGAEAVNWLVREALMPWTCETLCDEEDPSNRCDRSSQSSSSSRRASAPSTVAGMLFAALSEEVANRPSGPSSRSRTCSLENDVVWLPWERQYALAGRDGGGEHRLGPLEKVCLRSNAASGSSWNNVRSGLISGRLEPHVPTTLHCPTDSVPAAESASPPPRSLLPGTSSIACSLCEPQPPSAPAAARLAANGGCASTAAASLPPLLIEGSYPDLDALGTMLLYRLALPVLHLTSMERTSLIVRGGSGSVREGTNAGSRHTPGRPVPFLITWEEWSWLCGWDAVSPLLVMGSSAPYTLKDFLRQPEFGCAEGAEEEAALEDCLYRCTSSGTATHDSTLLETDAALGLPLFYARSRQSSRRMLIQIELAPDPFWQPPPDRAATATAARCETSRLTCSGSDESPYTHRRAERYALQPFTALASENVNVLVAPVDGGRTLRRHVEQLLGGCVAVIAPREHDDGDDKRRAHMYASHGYVVFSCGDGGGIHHSTPPQHYHGLSLDVVLLDPRLHLPRGDPIMKDDVNRTKTHNNGGVVHRTDTVATCRSGDDDERRMDGRRDDEEIIASLCFFRDRFTATCWGHHRPLSGNSFGSHRQGALVNGDRALNAVTALLSSPRQGRRDDDGDGAHRLGDYSPLWSSSSLPTTQSEGQKSIWVVDVRSGQVVWPAASTESSFPAFTPLECPYASSQDEHSVGLDWSSLRSAYAVVLPKNEGEWMT